MVNLSIFVERLREYMNECDLNASTLACKINCSRVTLSGLLNEAHAPSTEMLIKLVTFFNCSADYLLGLVEYPRLTEFLPVKPFATVLRQCLKNNELSEYRLQRDLEISSSLTYRWLSGKALPKINTLIRLKKYFGCSVDYLLGRES